MDCPSGDPSSWAFPPAHDIETKRALRRLECEDHAWGVTTVTMSEVCSPGESFACWEGKESWKVDNWLAEGALRRKSVALLVGEAGAGKTYAAWDLIVSVLRGEKWFGHFECECGPVYYQGGEGQEDMLRRRHLGVCIGRGIDIEEFNRNELRWLTFSVPKRSATGYATVPAHPLSTLTFREKLMRAVRSRPVRTRPALFVFDPLVTMVRDIDTDAEMASTVMNWSLELAEESNACVLFLHHMNKAEDKSQRGRIRGESTYVNLAQTVYVMEPAKSDPNLQLFYDNKQRDDASDKSRARFAVLRSFTPILEPHGFLAGAEPGVIRETHQVYISGEEAEAQEKEFLHEQEEAKKAAKAAAKASAEVPLTLEPTASASPRGASGPGVTVRDTRDALHQHIEAAAEVIRASAQPMTRFGVYTALRDRGLGKAHSTVEQILGWLIEDGRIQAHDTGSKVLYLAPSAE